VEIFVSHGAPLVSTTLGINDSGGKFATDGKQWEQYQTAENLK
jgi:hypothetical protein